MKLKELIKPNEFDRKGTEVKKLPGIFDKENLNIGAKSELKIHTFVRRATDTGNIFGRRTMVEK